MIWLFYIFIHQFLANSSWYFRAAVHYLLLFKFLYLIALYFLHILMQSVLLNFQIKYLNYIMCVTGYFNAFVYIPAYHKWSWIKQFKWSVLFKVGLIILTLYEGHVIGDYKTMLSWACTILFILREAKYNYHYTFKLQRKLCFILRYTYTHLYPPHWIDCANTHALRGAFLFHAYRSNSLTRMQRYQLGYLFHWGGTNLPSRDGRSAAFSVRHPGVDWPFSSIFVSLVVEKKFELSA